MMLCVTRDTMTHDMTLTVAVLELLSECWLLLGGGRHLQLARARVCSGLAQPVPGM